MTSIPDTDRARISEYCEEKIPDAMRDQVRIEATFRGDSVTLFECRAPWDPASPDWTRTKVARLRRGATQWELDCADGRGKWYRFDPAPNGTLDELLDEIDADTTGIFWG